ncbi:type II toxin-antitoxin system death-on-curing family toxin [Roseibacterium beibuensis]|nr:type II toxin-antitoxin system death-on-curing family toxin [Roseibacterium beibuensis]MCS6625852.1 type II toxin-antitoxin system death-on-curing family toxin [Roseibacterium beibuensis]
MTEPIWVPLAAVLAIHDRQIARHGGAPGMRDQALLEMGCARALNLAAYADAGLEEIASAYAFGISKAHAFVDGNKRTAFVTALTFLRLNGYSFRPPPVEGVKMMEDLASGQVSEAEFAKWLSDGMIPI